MTQAPHDVMLNARYGEPVDTYTWEHVVDCCLKALWEAGYDVVEHAVGVSTPPVLTGEGTAGASPPRPAPPLRPTPVDPMIYVQWVDSSMRHEQVDDDKLPTPSVLHTVGWLAAQSDEFVTIAREQNVDPDSYRWRGSVSIPRLAIVRLEVLSDPSRRMAHNNGGVS